MVSSGRNGTKEWIRAARASCTTTTLLTAQLAAYHAARLNALLAALLE